MQTKSKTKKIIKQEKNKDPTLGRWLKKTTPWDTMRPQEPLNVPQLCKQLLFPSFSTDQELIVKKLTCQYSAKWTAIKQNWQSVLIHDKVRSVTQRNARLYWQWHPSKQIKANLVVLSYLCVYLHNKCFLCVNPLKPFGHARKNGADHDDWIGRKEHKECWKDWKFG